MRRFRPINLGDCFNSPVRVPVTPDGNDPAWDGMVAEHLGRIPRKDDKCWGIPFRTRRTDDDSPALIVLHEQVEPVKVKLTGPATHICFLHIANRPEDYDANAAGGSVLAEYTIRYQDGAEHAQPIRMRFETNCPCEWGRHAFAAKSSNKPDLLNYDPTKYGWGFQQTGVMELGPNFGAWVYALELPDTQTPLESVTLRPIAGLTAVIGITLYNGPGHPLRHVPRRVYKLVLPQPVRQRDVSAEMDMGYAVRTYAVPGVVDESWVSSPEAGLGDPWPEPPRVGNEFLVELTGSLGATLAVKTPTGKHTLDFGKAYVEGTADSDDGQARVELVQGRKTWVHVSIIDTATGKPTPARVHFRGPHGEYIAPYGHSEEVNGRWFEDYGGDLQLGATNYAYVPGRFQIELPEGDVYVEISKGFEYAPVRQKLDIKHGQRELKLGISRWADRRTANWVTADTHVHFISPETAWLEGQAEGLNLINLLASQWGKLFTNVGDISGALSGCSREDTLIWVGTENRHHLLGHISMLGAKGDPVFPMCGGGPGEAWFGDADWMLLTEWAEQCKRQDGVVIRPHFPDPMCEEPVYMLLDKLDAAELRQFGDPDEQTLDKFNFSEWYRYLNCGCRVAAVGGTDKMSAGMPVGGVRTYAKLAPDDEFSFENWGKAVRAGRTFTTSGPIIDLVVEGRQIGDEIQLPSGGGSLEVKANAECAWPIHRMEIVANGSVVASTSSAGGEKRLSISERISIECSGWVAARCSSRMQVQHCWPIRLGAHTSPVYVTVGGQEAFNESDATYMLTLIDGGLTYLDTLSVRYDQDRHLAMKALFEQARQVVHRKMHQHGLQHGC